MSTEHQHPTSFGVRLRKARKARDITQTSLAESCGLCHTQISSFERGVREPSMTNLRKIVAALNVSADYLLGLTVGMRHDDVVVSAPAPAPIDRDARRALIHDVAVGMATR